MSLVQCLIIKGGLVVLRTLHYRQIREVLSFGRIPPSCIHTPALDCGYLIVDCNQKLVIDCQMACDLSGWSQEWDVLRLW